MSSATRTSFYRELGASLFSPARYATFAAFFTFSAAFLSAALQLGEGTLWTLEALWTISVALPLPILISLITMPLFAGERAAGTYESLALLPIPIRKIVIGKFSATFLTVCVALAGSIVPWLLLMPVIGCPAFTWDGIFTGATASKDLRNATLWCVVGFFGVWFAGLGLLRALQGTVPETRAIHLLMAAYFTHLFVRALYLTLRWRKAIPYA